MKKTITSLALTFTLLAPVASVGTPNSDNTGGTSTRSVGVSLPTQPKPSTFCQLFPFWLSCK